MRSGHDLQGPEDRRRLKILRKSRAPLFGIKKAGDLDPYLDQLQSRRLLDQDLMCLRSMQELIRLALLKLFLEGWHWPF
ncbi:MAG: hypothetical protein ACQEQX_06155 [Thermodesulfobacteriota bacterium]